MPSVALHTLNQLPRLNPPLDGKSLGQPAEIFTYQLGDGSLPFESYGPRIFQQLRIY